MIAKYCTRKEVRMPLSPAALRHQNRIYRGSGGRSQENRVQGFAPAFLDTETGIVYPACFADGRRAPMHLLDGLPDELVVERRESGSVSRVKATVIAGFTGRCRFFTRAQAARALRLMDRLNEKKSTTDSLNLSCH